jgi:hypothetical protein
MPEIEEKAHLLALPLEIRRIIYQLIPGDPVIVIGEYLNRVYSTSLNSVICLVRNYCPMEGSRNSALLLAFLIVSCSMKASV